ncbi:MAG TPA: hypothetical protein VMU39_13810 [Solirubrobacteraceae bacterium]|nr:hypothetical protein [Solirubrobacteraceae bacterium]
MEDVQAREAAPVRSSGRREAQVLLASLAWGTALIHVLAAAHHYHEWALYGVFFTILAPAQAIWGGLVYQHGDDRRVLLVGAAANLLVAVVWALSRTTGIPIGPTPWQPESAGWHDVMATVNELAMAGIAAGLAGVLPWRVSDVQLGRLARWIAIPLLVVTVLAASFAHEH